MTYHKITIECPDSNENSLIFHMSKIQEYLKDHGIKVVRIQLDEVKITTKLDEVGKNVNHTEVEISKLPNCDICKQHNITKPAQYAGKTTLGSWAYMCKEHFRQYGVGLGLGRGQKLKVSDKK